MTPKYRLLALDLDGTLLDSRLEPSAATRAAIADAQAAGVHVTIATGRMIRTAQPFADMLQITTPLITYQGAHVQTADGTVLYDNPLPADLAAEVVELALAEGLYIQAYIDDELWIVERSPEVEEYLGFSLVDIPVNIAPNLVEIVRQKPVTKLVWITDPTELERTMQEWGARWKGRLEIFRSHDHFGEAAAIGSSKGVGLAVLAEHLGIPQAEVAAIGDRENDASMLVWAGFGMAMGNADRFALAAANHVLPALSDDGAAYGIRHFVLGEE